MDFLLQKKGAIESSNWSRVQFSNLWIKNLLQITLFILVPVQYIRDFFFQCILQILYLLKNSDNIFCTLHPTTDMMNVIPNNHQIRSENLYILSFARCFFGSELFHFDIPYLPFPLLYNWGTDLLGSWIK